MTKLLLLACTGFVALGSSAWAQSEPNPIQGTPSSLFPTAAANEVEIINGVPCRTVLIPGENRRVPVECREPTTTGSIGGRIIYSSPQPDAPVAPYPGAPQ
jgi:hypothetical protein